MPSHLQNGEEKSTPSETEKRLANAQKIAHIGNWDMDIVNNRLYLSDEIYRIFGLLKENHAPNYDTFYSAIHPDDRAAWSIHRELVLKGSIPMDIEHRIVLPTGEIRHVHELGERISDANNQPLWLSGTIQDITERKLASQKYMDSEKRFRSLVQNGSDLIGILDKTGNYSYVSPTVKQVLGYEADYFIGKNAFSFIHPEDIATVMEHFGQLENHKDIEIKAFRFLDKNGNWRWIETKLTNLLDDPAIQGIVANSRDITEKKKSRDELENLSLIAKVSSNAVIITDVNGNITWVNNAFSRISGYKLGEVAGKKPGSFLQGPETDQATVRYLHDRITNRQAFNCEILNYSKSGQKYWMHVQGEPIFDETGQCTKFFAIENDISDLINAQEKIIASEQNYRYLFNQNPMPMWIIDQETLCYVEANEAAQCHYGYSATEFQQMNPTDINPKLDTDKLKSEAETILNSQGAKELGVQTHIKKNGESIFVEVTCHNIDYNGRKAVLVIANNVTEKIQLQNKLNRGLILKQREITEAVVEAQEKERMEVGKELHDNVNQLLGAARLYITALRDYKEDIDIMLDKSAGLISSAIEEVRKLSRTLTGPGMENLRLCDAIEGLVQLTTVTRTISISFDKEIFYEEDLSKKLKLNIFRIVQEQFNNILKHANASEVFISLYRDARKISLIIQDNGQGFDTFQTRNGIGITNIINRASLNNGKVRLESAPGKGCRLEVKFKIALTVSK